MIVARCCLLKEPGRRRIQSNERGGIIMAKRKKAKKKMGRQGDRRANPRQAPKMKIVESGQREQGEPVEARGARSAGQEAVLEKYRHGGIPIGSDPRE